jgi:hypothetical protein
MDFDVRVACSKVPRCDARMPIARDLCESWLSLILFVDRQRDALFDKAIFETEADIGRRQDGISES